MSADGIQRQEAQPKAAARRDADMLIRRGRDIDGAADERGAVRCRDDTRRQGLIKPPDQAFRKSRPDVLDHDRGRARGIEALQHGLKSRNPSCGRAEANDMAH